MIRKAKVGLRRQNKPKMTDPGREIVIKFITGGFGDDTDTVGEIFVV